MAQCPTCGCSHTGSGACGNCRRAADAAERSRREAREREREARRELRRTNPKLYAEMERKEREEEDRKADSSSLGFIALIVIVVLIVGIASLFHWAKGTYMNLASESAAVSLARGENTKTFLKKGTVIPDDKAIANKAALQAFAKSGASYRMEGKFRYGYRKIGETVKLSTQVKMFYNGETDVWQFVLESTGGDDKLDKAFRIADGTYSIVKKDGAVFVLSETGGAKTAAPAAENRAVYNFLMGYSMEKVLYTGVIDRAGSDRYHLWNVDYYCCRYKNIGYMVYSNPKTELRVWKDKPVSYLHKIKNEDTRIEYLFTLNFYYDDIPPEKPDMAEYQ